MRVSLSKLTSSHMARGRNRITTVSFLGSFSHALTWMTCQRWEFNRGNKNRISVSCMSGLHAFLHSYLCSPCGLYSMTVTTQPLHSN